MWYCRVIATDDHHRWKHYSYNIGTPSKRVIPGVAAVLDFPPGIPAGRDWLVESQDRLFLVNICFVDFDADNIADIRVYKLNFTATAWRRVHDIGDTVFLLEDANMAASGPASTLGLKSNQIYFMKNFKEDDADLCVFDLKSGRQEITRVHQQHDLRLYRKPFWIAAPND
ncbi:hypothetical protein EJB05_30102, partial [Eragrostis curvula]